jgi:L-lactate dehydrogenase complex protein LldF
VSPSNSKSSTRRSSSVYPGPIGAILVPQLVGIENAATLPFASTLCGACYEVCPVKIDIPKVLLHLRARAVEGNSHPAEGALMRSVAWVFGGPRRLAVAQSLARLGQRPFVHADSIRWLPGPLGKWTRTRDLGPVARQSFRSWWRRERT